MAAPSEAQTLMSSLTPAQITLIAGSVGAVTASLVAAIFSLLTTWLVKRAENERAVKELIINSALELHKQHLEIQKTRNSAVLPLDANVVYISVVANVLLSEKITEKNVGALLNKITSITDEVSKHERFCNGAAKT